MSVLRPTSMVRLNVLSALALLLVVFWYGTPDSRMVATARMLLFTMFCAFWSISLAAIYVGRGELLANNRRGQIGLFFGYLAGVLAIAARLGTMRHLLYEVSLEKGGTDF